MKKIFSVIIPTLNEELYLPKLLTDLRNQKAHNFEVIVVDGRSEDKTCQLVQKFDSYFPLTLHKVNKRDVAFQKNYGARMSEGDFLVFLDADCRINSTFTQKLEREVKKHHNLIYLPALTPQGGTYADKIMFKLSNFFIDISQNWDKPQPSAGEMIFQRDYFMFIGGFIESKSLDRKGFFPEDHEIIMRASIGGVRAKFMTKIPVRFSLRRMKKEGRFNVIRKLVISSLHMYTKGKINEDIFSYEMGGHLYQKLDKEKKQIKKKEEIDAFNSFLREVKRALNEFIEET